MPELPEVETVCRTLRNAVLGKKINKFELYYNKIIKEPDLISFINTIEGQKIHRIDRIGKYIIFVLDNNVLISHLRMEGKYFFNPDLEQIGDKHILAKIIFSDGTNLCYHDTRRFGTMNLQSKKDYLSNQPLAKLGYEPFDKEMTVDYLYNKIRKKRLAIKTCLLDQTIILGLGNIYANEVLFASKIDPQRSGESISKTEISKIIKNSIIILREAIKMGGTTIMSFQSSHGIDGKFTNKLLVHQRKDLPCNNCRTPIIKFKLNGRGTYSCPNCQN